MRTAWLLMIRLPRTSHDIIGLVFSRSWQLSCLARSYWNGKTGVFLTIPVFYLFGSRHVMVQHFARNFFENGLGCSRTRSKRTPNLDEKLCAFWAWMQRAHSGPSRLVFRRLGIFLDPFLGPLGLPGWSLDLLLILR